MAQKTFCDRCKDEIPLVKGVRSKFVLQLENERESAEGNISTNGAMKCELCHTCALVAEKGVRVILTGGSVK